MSGTSLDGIDVAVVEIQGRRWKLLKFQTTPYPPEVRRRILGISNAVAHIAEVSRLNFLLGELYARAVLRTEMKVDLIGCHGQTIYHEGGNTLQIGEASVIAERTGVPVISDFRTRDIAAGAKAPAGAIRGLSFVPACQAVPGSPEPGRDREHHHPSAEGEAGPDRRVRHRPANMVVDQLASIATNGRLCYDRGGRLAARGRLRRDLLDELLRDPYYRSKPPKTAGREQYGKEFVERLLATGEPVPNLIATATALTAASVALAIRRFAPRQVDELIVSGGGAHNPQIMAQLAALLKDTRILTSADFGVDVDAKEAIAFAVLAHETWRGRPGNLPSATGARRSVVLAS